MSMPPVDSDRWALYVQPEDGETPSLSVLFAADYRLETGRPEGYDRCLVIEVELSLTECQESGLPARDVLEDVVAVEQSLVRKLQLDETKCLFVAALTGGRLRRLVFQVAPEHEDRFSRTVSAQLGVCPFPFRLANAAPGWELFDRAVVPDEDCARQIKYRQLIDDLVAAGAVPGLAWPIQHMFRGRAEPLDQLVQALAGEGYQVEEWENERLILSCLTELDTMKVWSQAMGLSSMAASLNVLYDGWKAPAPEAVAAANEASA